MNSPGSVWWWLVFPALTGTGIYYLWLGICAWCAHIVARNVQAALDQETVHRLAAGLHPDADWKTRTRDRVVAEVRAGGYVRGGE